MFCYTEIKRYIGKYFASSGSNQSTANGLVIGFPIWTHKLIFSYQEA